MSSPGIDVHRIHPDDCDKCAMFPLDFACLEHTCPDCGSIVYAEHNELGELVHECPYDTPKLDKLMSRGTRWTYGDA